MIQEQDGIKIYYQACLKMNQTVFIGWKIMVIEMENSMDKSAEEGNSELENKYEEIPESATWERRRWKFCKKR